MGADPDLAALVADGEAALGRGDAAAAFARLAEASARVRADDGALARLVDALTTAARIVGEQPRVLAWIDQLLPATTDPRGRASLLRAALALWSRIDTERARALEPAALAAAEAAGDDEAIASVLALAGFVAYRRREVRRGRELAERARAMTPGSQTAQFQLLRTEMFAATAAGELEAGLHLSMKARALARELGRTVDIANESNNLAETYLELGYPHEAKACAHLAERLSRELGHVANQTWAQVFGATATAEAGDLAGALEILDGLAAAPHYPLVTIDACHAHAHWLLERGAAGDARRAADRARAGIDLAHRSGTAHRLTALHASLARAHARLAEHDAARDTLERARRGSDKVEPSSHSMLALASAEVMAASETARHVVLMTARVRILRTAGRREDPHAYCTGVRVNRRLLELTGGVPSDLPRAT